MCQYFEKIMKHRAYSQSLKKMKRKDTSGCSADKIDKIKEQIERTARINQKSSFKQIKDYVQVRKQLIKHKSPKNRIQQEVDKILKDFVRNNVFQISNPKINYKNNYSRYRIQTQPNQKSKKSSSRIQAQPKQRGKKSQKYDCKFSDKDENQQQGPLLQKQEVKQDKLPRIERSISQVNEQRSKTIKLKTEHQLVQRLNINSRNKIFEYKNVDIAIRQYRAGMTSLFSDGAYFNPHGKGWK